MSENAQKPSLDKKKTHEMMIILVDDRIVMIQSVTIYSDVLGTLCTEIRETVHS